MGGRYSRYLSDKIMTVFAQCGQLIQHVPNTLIVTGTAAVLLGRERRLRLLLFV